MSSPLEMERRVSSGSVPPSPAPWASYGQAVCFPYAHICTPGTQEEAGPGWGAAQHSLQLCPPLPHLRVHRSGSTLTLDGCGNDGNPLSTKKKKKAVWDLHPAGRLPCPFLFLSPPPLCRGHQQPGISRVYYLILTTLAQAHPSASQARVGRG